MKQTCLRIIILYEVQGIFESLQLKHYRVAPRGNCPETVLFMGGKKYGRVMPEEELPA